MFVLITYDVNITSPTGAKRLRKVAKLCQNYGKRVQNSVFECVLNESQFVSLKHQLEEVIIITWAILNGLGFIMAYITPFFAGGQWNG